MTALLEGHAKGVVAEQGRRRVMDSFELVPFVVACRHARCDPSLRGRPEQLRCSQAVAEGSCGACQSLGGNGHRPRLASLPSLTETLAMQALGFGAVTLQLGHEAEHGIRRGGAGGDVEREVTPT